MTTQIKLETKGFEEYFERLARAGKDIDEAAARALLAGAEVVEYEMLSLVPIRTGNLARHIKILGPIQDGNYHYVEVGVIHRIDFTDANTARYANSVEYGTSKMAAQPYIRPGIDRSKRRAVAAMKESLVQDGLL